MLFVLERYNVNKRARVLYNYSFENLFWGGDITVKIWNLTHLISNQFCIL